MTVFLSAKYANEDHASAVALTTEAGTMALSAVDTPEEWAALMASGVVIAPYVPPPVVTTVRKADIYARATDAEAEAIDAAIAAAGAKLRGLWSASLEFRSDSAYWPQIEAMAVQLFGQTRATELLASS